MSQTLIICERCRNPQCYCTCKNAPPSVNHIRCEKMDTCRQATDACAMHHNCFVSKRMVELEELEVKMASKEQWMLRAAHRMTARQHKRGVPLWSWVGAICCTGSGSAHTICREYGWDPSAPADRELPSANG